MRAARSCSSTASRATLAIAGSAVFATVIAGCGSSSKGGTTSATSALPSSTTTPATSSSAGTSSSSDKAAAYKSVLLTASEVSSITGQTFTSSAADDSDDSSSDSGCAAIDDFSKAAKAAEQGKAAIDFSNADQTQQAEEQLTFVPGQGEKLFTQFKDALSSCDTVAAGETTLKLAVQNDPDVEGADDTSAFTASAADSTNTIVVTGYIARFGDNIVQITYSAVTAKDSPVTGDVQLLGRAASKASSAFN